MNIPAKEGTVPYDMKIRLLLHFINEGWSVGYSEKKAGLVRMSKDFYKYRASQFYRIARELAEK